MSITRNFNLYLHAGMSIPLTINANQFDQGETWVFTLYNEDGTQYTPTTASIVGKKSDGNLIAIAETVNSTGQVVVTETEQMTAAAGKNEFELQIDNLTHGTANFIVMVEADPMQDGVVSESALSLIDQAINGGIPSEVRQAMYTLFSSAAYLDDDMTDEKAVIASWAAVVTAISISQSSISISGSGTYQLTATTTPSGGAVTWNSSNTAVATVSNNGLVTSVDNGTATITASCGGLTATCTVTVTGMATLSSISAVYSGGSVEIGTDIDDLKDELVVTAHYSDSSSVTLADSAYTLSGTLAVGTSTVTVSYQSKTTTFTVTVTEKWSYSISDLTKIVGTISNDTGATCGLSVHTNASTTDSQRRSFVLLDGVTSLDVLTSGVHSQTSDYYPVKIPAGATKITVAVTPTTQYVQLLLRVLNNGVYSTLTAEGPTGYQQHSITRTFSAVGDNAYACVTTKYDNSGTSYPTEPTGMDITFE